MRRRAYLASTAALGSGSFTGCLGLGETNEDVILPKPDRPYESADVIYPAWGQPVPDVTLHAPIAERAFDLGAIEEALFLTFFYSHCQTVCPMLVSTLRYVHRHGMQNGYADAVTFAPITFDPARDDATRLRDYADRMNINLTADNWHFLRPETEDRANTIVTDEFGVAFKRTEPPDGSDGGYMFTHTALTLLVNGDGYVERAYNTKRPDRETLVADLRRVRSA